MDAPTELSATERSRLMLRAMIASRFNITTELHPRGLTITDESLVDLIAAVCSDYTIDTVGRGYYLSSQPFIVAPAWTHRPITVAWLRLKATTRAGARKLRAAARANRKG